MCYVQPPSVLLTHCHAISQNLLPLLPPACPFLLRRLPPAGSACSPLPRSLCQFIHSCILRVAL